MNEHEELKKRLRMKAIKRNLRDAYDAIEEADFRARLDFRWDKIIYLMIGAALMAGIWFAVHLVSGEPKPIVVIPPLPVIATATIPAPVVIVATTTPIMATSTPSSTVSTSTK